MRYRRGGQPTAVVNRPVTGLTLSRRAASSRPAADRSTPSAPSVQRRHVRWQARIRLDGTGGRQATVTGTPPGANALSPGPPPMGCDGRHRLPDVTDIPTEPAPPDGREAA